MKSRLKNKKDFRDKTSYAITDEICKAALAGDVDDVIMRLVDHDEKRDGYFIKGKDGRSDVYSMAIKGAAASGRAGLVIKIFLTLEKYTVKRLQDNLGDSENYRCFWQGLDRNLFKHLIGGALFHAALHGHKDLVYDLTKLLELNYSDLRSNYFEVEESYIETLFFRKLKYREIEWRRSSSLYNAMKSAFSAALHGGQYPLAGELFSLGLTAKAASYYLFQECCNDTKRSEKIHGLFGHIDRKMSFDILDEQAYMSEDIRRMYNQVWYDMNIEQDEPKDEFKCFPTVSAKIKEKLFAELDSYINSYFTVHDNKAMALRVAIEQLSCVESIDTLVKHQVELMSTRPNNNSRGFSVSVFGTLAAKPSYTGHTCFHYLFKPYSPDFLDTLENCAKIIEDSQPKLVINDDKHGEKDVYEKLVHGR